MTYQPTEKAHRIQAPTGAHLALKISEDGEWMAIPEGATLWLVEDASRQDKIFPLILKQVRHNKLVFVMVDGNGGVTEYQFKLTTGKPKNRQALQRMQESRQGR